MLVEGPFHSNALQNLERWVFTLLRRKKNLRDENQPDNQQSIIIPDWKMILYIYSFLFAQSNLFQTENTPTFFQKKNYVSLWKKTLYSKSYFTQKVIITTVQCISEATKVKVCIMQRGLCQSSII